MTNYIEIYDEIYNTVAHYNSPIYSPGLRLVMANQQRLQNIEGRHLDVGCGPAFVVEYMRVVMKKASVGVDVSSVAVSLANERVGQTVAYTIVNNRAPFEDGSFNLVTCFDLLEHLDESEIHALWAEIRRLVTKGGTLFCNISLRPAATLDHNGENLHRTIKPADWWDRIFDFDEYHVSKRDMEMTGWKAMK